MPKFTISLSDVDLANLKSHASFVEKTTMSGVVQNWIYRYAYPEHYRQADRYQQIVDVDAEILRAVDKITSTYNLRHGHANHRIGRFPVHDFDGWKANDTYNALLRRGIADMIAKGDCDP